jgi:hypothetical protein
MENATHKSADGAENVVTASGVTYFFAAISVLLVREKQHAKGRREELVVRGSGKVESAGPSPELQFVEVERVRGVFANRGTVFPRAHQKIVRKDDEIPDGFAGFGGLGIVSDHVGEVLKDRNGNRLDAAWRWVRLGVVVQLVLEPEVNGAVGV